MSSSSAVTENVSERVRDPRVDAWNDAPSGLAGTIEPTIPDGPAPLEELASVHGEPEAASALANVGRVTMEQFLGLAAPLMTVIGSYSMMAGVHEVLANFSKGDIGSAMYRFGLVGASAPS